MKSNKKEADEFHFVAFLKSHTSQKGLRAKVSDSQMTGGGGQGEIICVHTGETNLSGA